ncbi:protein-tyrosine phosphatase-like protein [Earliella scabrosa]|nr:protein-tyrosine phosphatase-like protein [Earliella scabrosa]
MTSAPESNLPPFLVGDPQIVAATLAAPPFVSVDGICNIRDFGASYASSVSSSNGASAHIKPLHLFRSAEPSRITEKGIEQLKALGIRKVFDLRVEDEIARYGTAMRDVEGVQFVRVPVVGEKMGPIEIIAKLKEFAEDETEAFVRMYIRMLTVGGHAVEKVLVHLRDNADEPCLIHCTAGKDRSGVLAAVILMLLGARDEDIAADYALTTIGLQPLVPLLAARFAKEEAWRNNPQGALNLGAAKAETMQAVLDAIGTEFGGVEGYLKRYTSLREDDFAHIRKNLIENGL